MQYRAEFRFWGRLRQLAPRKSGGHSEYLFFGQPAIKDSIEALGVPHTEVDRIIVAEEPVGFSYRLQDGDRVAVYPFGYFPSTPDIGLSPPLPGRIGFILDVHLGRLARWLRLLGFDCRYRNDYSDPQIIALALQEDLIILTRDRGILKHACVEQGYLIASQQVHEQVEEVLQRYRLYRHIQKFRRCPTCNGLLMSVTKEQIAARLQPKTARYYHDFHRCRDCGQIYWQGSHYEKIADRLQRLQRSDIDDEIGKRGHL